MTERNQQFQLSDGRRLGYDERGAPAGKPVFYLHGSPSSRVESNLFVSDELLQSLNVRLIAVDRPGMGLSDFQPNRRLLDFPNDLLALADHLKIERFAILAYSGGGPYGEACALSIPDRLTRVGIVSGAAPFNLPGLTEGIPADNLRYFDLPFVFLPGTPLFAQDMLGYAFMTAATLSAAPVFAGGKLESWIKWLFIFHAILFLPAIVIPAIPMPVNEAGTGVGNLIGRYANMVWCLYFGAATTLVTLLFKRAVWLGARG